MRTLKEIPFQWGVNFNTKLAVVLSPSGFVKLSHEPHQVVNDAALQIARTAQHLLPVAVV